MEVIKLKDGSNRYREMIFINGKAIKSKTYKRKSDAISWKHNECSKRDRAKHIGLRLDGGATTFYEYSLEWLERKIKPIRTARTYQEYRRIIENHYKDTIGNKSLVEITKNDGLLLINKLKMSNHNNKGVNIILQPLKTIMQDAVDNDYIVKSPFKSLKKLKEDPVPDRFWSKSDIRSFFEVSSESEFANLYILALNTGMRIGELCALKWDDISYQSNLITVCRTRDDKGVRNRTKSGLIRRVPINQACKEALSRVAKSSNFIFAKEDGSLFTLRYLSENLRKLQKLANVETLISPHGLRHTFASHFMMNGGNPYDLQKILGHSDFAMTQKYAHLSQDYMSQATEFLNFGTCKKLDVNHNLTTQMEEREMINDSGELQG